MILKHEKFSKFVRNPAWMARVKCAVMDEAHCIVYWGKSFRKDFDDLGKLRSFMTMNTPFLIASATFSPTILDETLNKLEFNRNKMFKLNLGNDRANITPIVCELPGKGDDFKALEFVTRPAHEGRELDRTIIYVNERDTAKDICEHLWEVLPPEYHGQVDFIHSLRDPLTKQRVMRLFREGVIKVLIATEVAGMVRLHHSIKIGCYM